MIPALLLLSVVLAGPPAPQPVCPSHQEWSLRAGEWACRSAAEVHPKITKRLSRTEVILPGALTLLPMALTHIQLNRGRYEAWPLMQWGMDHRKAVWAARGTAAVAISYAAHRSQKRWLVYGWSTLMGAEALHDFGVVITWR